MSVSPLDFSHAVAPSRPLSRPARRWLGLAASATLFLAGTLVLGAAVQSTPSSAASDDEARKEFDLNPAAPIDPDIPMPAPAPGAADPPESAPSDLPPSPAWTDNRCGDCHQRQALFSHPINVAPRMTVPASFPLEEGQITCATCHDNSNAQAHAQARRDHQPMLRGTARGQEFCAQCHYSTQNSREDMHGRYLGKAHLKLPDNNAASRAGGNLDADSRLCLSCHDGSLATDVGGAEPDGGFNREHGKSHPIGVAMQSLARSPLEIGLNPASSLDSRIRLFDGNVGCGSCHSPFSTEKRLLVMSNLGSKLCLNCHDMK